MPQIATDPTPRVPAGEEERRLVAALRRGDEDAFLTLVSRYGSTMLRVAQSHVRSRAVAEEVVQETWMAVLTGIERFEERAALKTWLFRILTNRAKTRGEREHRTVPFSALESDGDEDAFAPDGHWAAEPREWRELPEERLLAGEALDRVQRAIDLLPARQRQVITLRDVEGWSAEEVCDALGLREGNQRVLLHRARGKVRAALDGYLQGELALA